MCSPHTTHSHQLVFPWPPCLSPRLSLVPSLPSSLPPFSFTHLIFSSPLFTSHSHCLPPLLPPCCLHIISHLLSLCFLFRPSPKPVSPLHLLNNLAFSHVVSLLIKCGVHCLENVTIDFSFYREVGSHFISRNPLPATLPFPQ